MQLRKSEFNTLLFLALYCILKYGFYVYVGLTTTGGRLSFPFLANYINVPEWLTLGVAQSSKLLLQAGGYLVYQKSPANVTISGSRGVTLAWGCLGIGAISLWIAFITAHRRTAAWYKLKWIVAGVVLIFLVNVIRIDMIALSNYYRWAYFQSFNAHTGFDAITYLVILLMMIIFVMRYNRGKKIRIDTA
jgi:exosortase/archaeosortase family protein